MFTVILQLNKSDAHRVVLRDLQPNYTGKYLCEVSGDSPSFTTLVDVGYMHVASKYRNFNYFNYCPYNFTVVVLSSVITWMK